MISAELKELIQDSFYRSEEKRDIVPVNKIHSIILERLDKLKINSEQERQKMVARYSPLGEYLSSPQTIEHFQDTKRFLTGLYWKSKNSSPYYWSKELLDENYLLSDSLQAHKDTQNKWNITWGSSISWLLYLSSKLKIILPENINLERRKSVDVNQVWYKVEGDKPDKAEETFVHRDTEDLLKHLNEIYSPGWYTPKAIRKGLVVGDFRVGDHSAHGALFENAKAALGKNGVLVMETPTKKTILNTTTKTDCWEDNERIYKLSRNPYINELLLLDMPEEYYDNPDLYYTEFYKKLRPDFVFLGEKNHPLENNFKIRTQYYGGVLLIDDKPIVQRSSALI
jgi:hypothetical protein